MGRVGLMMVIAALGCTTPKAAEQPAEPVKAEPVAQPPPAEPVAEPVKAAEPAEPVKAAEPAEPVKAAEPAEPVKPPVKAAEPVKTAVAEPDKKFERAWKSKCGSCHGADGKAATTKGKKMKMNDISTRAWQTSHTDAELKKAINEGGKKEKDGVSQEMDAYSDLGAEMVNGLVAYMRWLGR